MNSEPFDSERCRLSQELSSYCELCEEAAAAFVTNLKEQRARLHELHQCHSALRPEIQSVRAALDELERSFNRQVDEGRAMFNQAVERRMQSIDAAQQVGQTTLPD
jgi:hypothetical protein